MKEFFVNNWLLLGAFVLVIAACEIGRFFVKRKVDGGEAEYSTLWVIVVCGVIDVLIYSVFAWLSILICEEGGVSKQMAESLGMTLADVSRIVRWLAWGAVGLIALQWLVLVPLNLIPEGIANIFVPFFNILRKLHNVGISIIFMVLGFVLVMTLLVALLF